MSSRRKSSRSIAAAGFLGAALLLSQPATAAEGLVNGGFDGGVAPWTASGGIAVNELANKALIGFNTSFADASGTLSQTFTTTSDGVFDYAFDAGRGEIFCGCGEPVTFQVFLDGVMLADLSLPFGGSTPQSTPLSHYAGSQALAAGDHTFTFSMGRFASSFGRAPYIVIDGVSGVLTPNVVDPGGAVPEPATWALLIAGFGMAGAGLRRRRAALA